MLRGKKGNLEGGAGKVRTAFLKAGRPTHCVGTVNYPRGGGALPL